MNRNTSNKLISICFIIIISFSLATYIDKETFIDPIKEDIKFAFENFPENLNSKEKIKTLITNIDTEVNDYKYKSAYLNINTTFNLLIGKKIFSDQITNVTFLKNDMTTTVNKKIDMTAYGNSLIDLNNNLKKEDINLFYVQLPYKINESNKLLEPYLVDYSNENANELLKIIKSDIEYIDIRKEIHESHLEHYDLFFKYDHHWKPETAFWAFGELSNKLNRDYGFDITDKEINIDNYNIDVYNDIFLGSNARRIGAFNTGVEDLSLIYPKFKTSYTYDKTDINVKLEGQFEDVMFQYSWLDIDNFYKSNAYSAYSHGDGSLRIITNNNIDNDNSVLIMSDSFGNTLIPYLSLGVKTIYDVDLREYDKNILDLINKEEVDNVIIMYNPSVFSNVMFDFEKENTD